VLPRPLRLTTAADHRAVVRRGRRAGGGALTVHLLLPPSRRPGTGGTSSTRIRPSRAGLVVGKTVGNAVIRHRVSRQLRHLLADRMGSLPSGALVVVRAGAAAGTADLAADLDAALGRLDRSTAHRRASP